MTNSTKSIFSNLTNENNITLPNMVFVAQYISVKDLDINNFKKNILSIREKSDNILKFFPTLQFLEPLNNSNAKNFFINANNLNISSVKFDGTVLSFTLSDNKKFTKSLSFNASNFIVTNRSYALNPDNNQFEMEYEDKEENEHINDILEDFQNIFDIYFSENNGVNTMHIFLLEDNIESDLSGFAEMIEMKFDFTSVS
jgi:hypothetical protein